MSRPVWKGFFPSCIDGCHPLYSKTQLDLRSLGECPESCAPGFWGSTSGDLCVRTHQHLRKMSAFPIVVLPHSHFQHLINNQHLAKMWAVRVQISTSSLRGSVILFTQQMCKYDSARNDFPPRLTCWHRLGFQQFILGVFKLPSWGWPTRESE